MARHEHRHTHPTGDARGLHHPVVGKGEGAALGVHEGAALLVPVPAEVQELRLVAVEDPQEILAPGRVLTHHLRGVLPGGRSQLVLNALHLLVDPQPLVRGVRGDQQHGGGADDGHGGLLSPQGGGLAGQRRLSSPSSVAHNRKVLCRSSGYGSRSPPASART